MIGFMQLPIPTASPFRTPPRIDAGAIEEVRLEAGSKCQLRCPACPTGKRETKNTPIGWGWLKPDDFDGFLERHPQVRRVELSNYGEILLNPDLVRIAAIADARGVELSAANGVNLNSATEESLGALARFRRITMSIDGCSQETYAQYRVGGNFDAVWRNALRLIELRREAGLPLADIVWQFVVFPHNEHEARAARERAAELGISFFPKMSWDGSHAKLRDPAAVALLLGASEAEAARPGEFLDRHFRDDNGAARLCEQLWTTPQINWDGTLLGCCVNFTAGFGNVFRSGLAEAMASPEYRQLLDVVAGKRLAVAGQPCAGCGIYKKTLAPAYKWRLFPERAARWLRRRMPPRKGPTPPPSPR